VLPIYEQGDTVRFAAVPADLDRPPTVWTTPRVVYLQHPSDPITRWEPRLMVRRPAWPAEPRGADVLPSMRWYPFVTFWQVSADMAVSNGVPPGHGHNFGAMPVQAALTWPGATLQVAGFLFGLNSWSPASSGRCCA
jgi:uncharacterized membrane protein